MGSEKANKKFGSGEHAKSKRGRDIDGRILNTFWNLAEKSDHTRINGAELLLKLLLERQGENTKEPCKEMSYTINRLLRGLSSTRDGARIGYATALTQLLCSSGGLYDIKTIIVRINEQLKVISRKDSKRDMSATLLGRALAYHCIARSDLVSEVDSSQLTDLVNAIMSLRKQKPSVGILCTDAIVVIMSKLDKSRFREHIWPLIESELQRGWEGCDADTLLLLIHARQHKLIDKHFLMTHYGGKKIVADANMMAISKVVSQSFVLNQSGHPVSLALLNESAAKEHTFNDFWDKVVYGGLFISADSKTKRAHCMHLVGKGLHLITSATQVKHILPSQMLATVIKNLSNKDQSLHDAALKLVTDVVGFIKSCSSGEIQVSLLTSFLLPPSHFNFDTITKTKTVSTIISHLNADGCRLLAQFLIDLIIKKESNSSLVDTDVRSRWAVMCLSSLVSHVAMVSETQWRLSLLQFLFLTAFFTVNKATSKLPHCDHQVDGAVQSTTFRSSARDALYRALNKSTSLSADKSVTMRLNRDQQPYINLLHDLVKYADTLLEHKKYVTPVSDMDAVIPQWKKTIAIINDIRQAGHATDDGTNKGCAFLLLFLYHALQLFTDSTTSSSDVITELFTCYEKACIPENKKKHKGSECDEPHWVDVLVDLLMSLLSQDSHLVRTVVSVVFTLICPLLTVTSVKLIVEVLKPSAATDDIIQFDDEDDDDGVEEMDCSNGHSHSGTSSDLTSDKDEERAVESSSDEEEDEEEEDDDTAVLVDEQLRTAVQAALGDAAIASDDDKEDSPSDLDDDAMFKLDDMLASAFRGMKKGKKTDKEQKLRQLTHYKMRCLDLVELLVHHCTTAHLIVELIMPLLEIIEHGYLAEKAKELSTRSSKLLRSVCQWKKNHQTVALPVDELTVLLLQLIEKSTKVSSSGGLLYKDIAMACIFVMRLIFGVDSESISANNSMQAMPAQKLTSFPTIHDALVSMIENFCEKRASNVSHVFLQTLLERQPVLLWPITAKLVPYIASPDVRVFCRTQICSMLASMINKKTAQKIGQTTWQSFASTTFVQNCEILINADSDHLKPKYLEELLHLTNKIIVATENDAIFQEQVPAGFIDKIGLLKSVNKEVRKLGNCIGSHLSGSNAGKTKESTKRKCELDTITNIRHNSVQRQEDETNKDKRTKKLSTAGNGDSISGTDNGKVVNGGDDYTEENHVTKSAKHKSKDKQKQVVETSFADDLSSPPLKKKCKRQ